MPDIKDGGYVVLDPLSEVTVNSGLDMNTSALALEAGGNLAIIAGDTTSLDGKVTACNTGAIAGTVTANAGTNLNTSALATQVTAAIIAGDTTSLDGKVPSLGQAVPGSSVPVVAPDATVTTALNGVLMDQDRLSAVIDKSGYNKVSVIAASTQGAGAPDHVGVVKIFAGNTTVAAVSVELAVPQLNITNTGAVFLGGMEIETAFPYIWLMYDFTSGGADDTLVVTVAASE